jgi:nucleoside-diphosphate-sugar epimerase
MKVMIIGATGTIGRAVVEKLSARYTVIKEGTSGDVLVDIINDRLRHRDLVTPMKRVSHCSFT